MSQSNLDSALEFVSNCTIGVYDDECPLGTGVIISPTLVATCEHVVGQRERVSIKQGARYISAEVYKRDVLWDIAILRVSLRFRNYLSGKTLTPRPGQRVLVLGFPVLKEYDSASPSLSEGVVSKVHYDQLGKPRLIQINAAVTEGYSGGPVFDETGRLLGMVSTKLFDGMASAVPGDCVFSLVPRHELRPTAASFSEYRRREIEAYEKWAVFKSYIDLRCLTRRGDKLDLSEYVRSQWLPDESRSLLAILGEFGSGKTLFCHKLTYDLLKDYQPGNRLPVFIKLRDMTEYRYKTIRDLLVDQVETKLGLPGLTWRILAELLRSGELLIIYDGFEEMSVKASKFQMLDNFRGIVATMTPGSKTIITCRTHYFNTKDEERILTKVNRPDEIESLILEESNPDNVSVVYLDPFDESDIQSYLKSKLESWQDLYERINDPAFYDLADLAKRPIFLDVIVESAADLDDTDRRITGPQLYQLYTERCFEREAKRSGLSPDEQSKLMEDLAFDAYKDRHNSLSRELIQSVWTRLVPIKAERDGEKFIRNYPFLKRAESSEERLDFIHQSFFEFFVARRIFRSIHSRHHSLYAAEYLTSPIDRYLFDLLDLNNDGEVISTWLKRHPDINVRMNCALTLERARRGEFVTTLQDCLENEQDIGVAGRIADALAGLGDKQSLVRFLNNLEKYAEREQDPGKPADHRLLYEIVEPIEEIEPEVIAAVVRNLEHPNRRVRKFAAFALGRMRAREGVNGLIELLGDSSENVRTRRYAAAALGIIGSASAIPSLSRIGSEENEYLQHECSRAIDRIREGAKS